MLESLWKDICHNFLAIMEWTYVRQPQSSTLTFHHLQHDQSNVQLYESLKVHEALRSNSQTLF